MQASEASLSFHMTLAELRYALAVAQERHFGRAAVLCHVSQPTLSVAIKKLESELCVMIFERHRNEVRLTDIGHKIIEQAQRVIQEASTLEDLVVASKHQLNSPLKIGAIYTVAPYIFPTLIPQIKKLAPEMPLFIQENFTSELRVKLQTGALDVIVIALPFTETSVVVKPLYEEPFVVLVPNTHPLMRKKSVSAEDLAFENTLLLGEGHCFRDQVISACPLCYRPSELQQVMEGTSLETLRHMVASGMGITILPTTATQVTYYAGCLSILPFEKNPPKRTIALAWRVSFPRIKAIELLLNAFTNANLNGVCPIA